MNLEFAAQAFRLFQQYASIVDSACQDGNYLRLLLFDDGSGRICRNDCVSILNFADLDDLVHILSEKLKLV